VEWTALEDLGSKVRRRQLTFFGHMTHADADQCQQMQPCVYQMSCKKRNCPVSGDGLKVGIEHRGTAGVESLLTKRSRLHTIGPDGV